MNVGFVGLGKLGLPCALAIESLGHRVWGTDPSPTVARTVGCRTLPYEEPDAARLLQTSELEVVELDRLVQWADILFLAVQTPHEPLYEGVTRLPESRCDFDYSALRAAVTQVDAAARRAGKSSRLALISTVLPGTIRREILPLCGPLLEICYNPFFIAMGRVVKDFLEPEFVLIGGDHTDWLSQFYHTLHRRPQVVLSLETAELVKMAYNTFIGMKIVFANTMMEVCHKLGADCDGVARAMALATDRLISGRYLYGGMGDGGGCFPPGELVMTAAGPVPIDQVAPGDMVLTIDGTYAPVVKRWERQYDGELVVVQVEGMPPVRETVEHPLYVRDDTRKIKSDGRRDTEHPISARLGDIRPVEADRLQARAQFAAWPILLGEVERPGHATDSYCYMAGWYLAEGSLDTRYHKHSLRSGRITFDLHRRELSVAQKLATCTLELDPPKPTHAKGGGAAATISCVDNKSSMRRGSSHLTKLLGADFGRGCRGKKLPDWVLRGDARTQAMILHGMINGDGGSYCKRVEFNTTSAALAFGVTMILDRLGCVGNLRLVKARGHRTRGGFKGSGDYYVVRVGSAENVTRLERLLDIPSQRRVIRYPLTRSPVVDGHRMRRIHSLRREKYTGPVYNLWVDHPTHTFVTAAGAQANCHPRDGIAMSWLAQQLDLSHDLFADLMKAREDQTEWLAELALREAGELPLVLLGRAFKPDVSSEVGSPARLLAGMLRERGVQFTHQDVMIDLVPPDVSRVAAYVLTTAHTSYRDLRFPAGAVVVDPFGITPDQPGVRVVRVGRSSH